MAYSHDDFNIKDIQNYELNTKANVDQLLVKQASDELTIKPNSEKEYKEYFGEMEISQKQVDSRVSIADSIEEVMIFIFMLIRLQIEKYGEVDSLETSEVLMKRMNKAVKPFVALDSTVADYIATFSMQIISSTIPRIFARTSEQLDASYWLSVERAINIAKNEANVFLNYSDYTKAVKKGATQKTWISMRDERVRDNHAIADGTTIPINDYFVVGDSLMLFPHDAMNGADEEELVGCRCSVEYK